jgi:nucleotidyltransferase substrate binding protein (TIGR01987 family)
MSTTVNELLKASESLKTAKSLLKQAMTENSANIELHKALRDSCIQRFEFCIELAWKVSIKLLGLQTKAPNPAIRDMAQNNLIDNPDVWFEFLLARNKTSHSYDEDIAREVYAEIQKFIPELDKLLSNLEKIK